MDIARAKLHRLFDEVVDRAHDRRAAGQVPQIVDVLFSGPGLALPSVRRDAVVAFKLGAQSGRDVLERGRYKLERRSENDFSRLQRLSIARIARGQRIGSVGCLEGEYRSLAQKPRREEIRQRMEFRQLQKRQLTQAEKCGDFVGEFMRGEICQFPQSLQ